MNVPFIDLSPEDFWKSFCQEPDAILLDVRTEKEFNQLHLKGALLLNINSGTFMEDIERLDKTKTYFVYCAVGGRSRVACGLMASRGFERLYNLAGGMAAWLQRGMPVERPCSEE